MHPVLFQTRNVRAPSGGAPLPDLYRTGEEVRNIKAERDRGSRPGDPTPEPGVLPCPALHTRACSPPSAMCEQPPLLASPADSLASTSTGDQRPTAPASQPPSQTGPSPGHVPFPFWTAERHSHTATWGWQRRGAAPRVCVVRQRAPGFVSGSRPSTVPAAKLHLMDLMVTRCPHLPPPPQGRTQRRKPRPGRENGVPQCTAAERGAGFSVR